MYFYSSLLSCWQSPDQVRHECLSPACFVSRTLYHRLDYEYAVGTVLSQELHTVVGTVTCMTCSAHTEYLRRMLLTSNDHMLILSILSIVSYLLLSIVVEGTTGKLQQHLPRTRKPKRAVKESAKRRHHYLNQVTTG